MVIALLLVGSVPLLSYFGWCSWRYFSALRKSMGFDPDAPGPADAFGEQENEVRSVAYKQHDDPGLESLRRRAMLAIALWFGYMILGYSFWAALVGGVSR